LVAFAAAQGVPTQRLVEAAKMSISPDVDPDTLRLCLSVGEHGELRGQHRDGSPYVQELSKDERTKISRLMNAISRI